MIAAAPPSPPPPVALEGRSVVLAGGPLGGRRPLLAGAMHYFRVEPRHWGSCLRALRGLGFTFVDTAVPWSLHERAPGRFDFSGGRDLGAFLDACAGEGLAVLLRVGPVVGCELLHGGLPERIVASPAMQARSGRGTPVVVVLPPRGGPLPSYESRAFLEEVARFYRAVGEIVGPRLCPAGPVAIVAIDHELGGTFRAGPFCADYHPELLARFAEQHGGAEPPRRWPRPTPSEPGALAPILAWLAFRERRIPAVLGALGAHLDAAGITSAAGAARPEGAGGPAAAASAGGTAPGALRLHGFSSLPPVVHDVAAAEEVVDVAGAGLPLVAGGYATTAARARYLAGSSRFPVASSLALGGPAWGPARDVAAAVPQLLAALMHGAVGYAGAMAVGRDRWVGSPVDGTGQLEPALAGPLGRIHRALGEADWMGLRAPAEVGLLVPREYTRLGLAASYLGPLAALAEPLRLDRAGARPDRFGFAGPIQIEHAAAAEAVAGGLRRAGIPFVVLDGSTGMERLRALRVVILLTFDFLDPVLVARVREFAAGGGKVLSGPRVPHLDLGMQPADVALPGERFDAAALADRAALAALAGPARVSNARALDAGVDVVAHLQADGTPALLFVGTTADAPAKYQVELAHRGTFTDVLSGERHSGATLTIPLDAGAVRLLSAG